MLMNAPGLTELKLIGSRGDFLARIAPEARLQLRAVRFVVDVAADIASPKLYPSVDVLQVLSTLPALRCLEVYLDLDCFPVDFTGFHALETLHIIDCGAGDATWFLGRCSSPRLRQLFIYLTNLCCELEWQDMHPLCATIADHAHQLKTLDIHFCCFAEAPAQSPDMLLTAAHPLLSLRHLSFVSLWFKYGEFVLSDAVLEAFAEAWPMLVSFHICFDTLPPNRSHGPRLHPRTVTLRALRAFSRHCPKLRTLHIPHLYVSTEDYIDTSGVAEQPPRATGPTHPLGVLMVCRAIILDRYGCASELHRIFPHLLVHLSRDLYGGQHPNRHSGHTSHSLYASQQYRDELWFEDAWLDMLGVLDGLVSLRTTCL